MSVIFLDKAESSDWVPRFKLLMKIEAHIVKTPLLFRYFGYFTSRMQVLNINGTQPKTTSILVGLFERA